MRSRMRFLALVLASLSTAACQQTNPDPAARQAAAAPEQSTQEGWPSEAEAGPLIVFFGDSLTAGLGLSSDRAFPAITAALLREEGFEVRVVNAGVSGETTAGGLTRVSWVLRQQPDVFVLELGANDGLRGQPVAATEENLRGLIEKARQVGAVVVLLGMQLPPSYGAEYSSEFARMYRRIARDTGVPLVASFLEGVGGHPELNLPDGIHPNEEGHRRLAENLLDSLVEILESQEF